MIEIVTKTHRFVRGEGWVGGGGGVLVIERKHNTSKYSKYWMGDSSVLEKICKNYQKLGWWSDDTGKNLQRFSKMGWVGGFGVLADFFSIRSANFFLTHTQYKFTIIEPGTLSSNIYY